jgi:hypothetical protein
MRLLSVLVLLAVFVAVCAPRSLGCVGARPLAMGGTFVALADDVQATYWNPAGLAQLSPGAVQGTFMHTTTNRDIINYQEYAALAGRLTKPLSRGIGPVALGLSYIQSRELLRDTAGVLLRDDQRRFWLSAAVQVGHAGMVGANVRTVSDSLERGYSVTTDLAFDVGYLYRVDDRLSVGLLVQNANRPSMKYNGAAFASYARNWRPGIAYRPRKNAVIVLDGYDSGDEARLRSFRAGAELTLGRFALRGGYYGFGGSNVPRSATFGVGVNAARADFDFALMTGDLDNTVILSAGFKR